LKDDPADDFAYGWRDGDSVTEAHGSALSPVFAGLRIGLHVLVIGLTALVIAVAPAAGFPDAVVIDCVAAVFLGSYGAGAFLGRSLAGTGAGAGAGTLIPRLWIALLSLEWLILVAFSAEAMYLVFPLFFLYLHFLSGWRGAAAVAASTVLGIVAFGFHRGFSLAGIIGPVIGAAVALAIGLGYRSLAREAKERERLIVELTETRAQLAVAERAAGVLDERGRLAREIHDTVSQSLSSIVMLLHAAERSHDVPEIATQRMLQARTAATDALAETRQFINELAPPALGTATIVDALARLAHQVSETADLEIDVTVSGTIGSLPTSIEAALLRIAQSALANVVQHASASRVDLTLTMLDNEVILDVVDDGTGFEAKKALRRPTKAASFGLRAMRERASQLGGTVVVESKPGRGTSVVASFEVAE
jgi:signal transduction histidine kinase